MRAKEISRYQVLLNQLQQNNRSKRAAIREVWQ
jgi:hypothetical protein